MSLLSMTRVLGVALLVGTAWAVLSKCSGTMCVSLAQSGSNLEYTLQSKSSLANTGWMAIGFGSQMVGSEMVVLWPNDDGNVTLSRRKAVAQQLPPVDPSPIMAAALATNGTQISSSSNPVIAFTVPLSGQSQLTFIWAFSPDRPNSASPSASFTQHSDMGTYTFDLASNSNSTSGPISQPWAPYQKKIVAHAALASIGFLVLLPTGALLARLTRTITPVWFQGHWIFNFGFAAPLIIAGVSLASSSMHDAGGDSTKSTHKTVGLVLCALYAIQVTLGALIHWIKPRSQRLRGQRPPQNYVHALLGLTIIALAFYQVRTGYRDEFPRYAQIAVPKGVNAAWIAWLIIVLVAYVGGLALLPRQWKQELQAQRPHQQDNLKMDSYESK